MKYYFAPLEGISGYIYRNAHHNIFPGVDKYFTPFLSPNQHHAFTKSSLRDILPENNPDICIVPQILTKHADDFIWAVKYLSKMGYKEINLNLGCPSGTVVSKGKGCGFLADPIKLDEFLYEIFSNQVCKISIKTRIGIAEDDQFDKILEIFNKYPIYELTIHPRLRRDFYRGSLHLDVFKKAITTSKNPICYNGDLSTASDIKTFFEHYPTVESIMIGRGLIANPSLISQVKSSKCVDKFTLKAFHDMVYEGYCKAFGSKKNAIFRMKEYWFYHIHLFSDSATYAKKIKRVSSPDDYEAIVNGIFRDLKLMQDVSLIPKIK